MVSRLGLDPEVAIVNSDTGEARSAHLFPFVADGIQKFSFSNGHESLVGSEVERDGAAVEVRSVVNSACRDNIIPYVAEALRQTQLHMEKEIGDGFVLSSTPGYTLDEISLQDPPADVIEFGCRPDFDAYEMAVKDPSVPEGDRRRWTGGHIHASSFYGAQNNIEQQSALAVAFDYYVGLPMVSILGDKFANLEVDRRQFYGQPGSFRYDDKLNKIEYRSLSGRLLLHPILLSWALGAVKSFNDGLTWSSTGNGKGGPLDFMVRVSNEVVPADIVREAILTHDVKRAKELVPIIYPTLTNFNPNDGALRYSLSGGGGSTMNPYFFFKAWELLTAATEEGLMWDDDMKYNWGLYSDYTPTHHKYWGIHSAMVKGCDDMIFPMNALVDTIVPKDFIQSSPIYTHPLNGGKSSWTTPRAKVWLA